MSVYQKILAVMGEIKYLQQDDSIKAGGEYYKAITEEKVTSTVRAAMLKHGLVIFPSSMVRTMDRYEVVRASGKTGIDYVSSVDVMYTLADTETGETITVASSGTGIDTGDKAIGKAMTYAYKYALLRTFAIPTGEDPDKVASTDTAPAARKSSTGNGENRATETAKTAQSPVPADWVARAKAAGLTKGTITDAQRAELGRLCTTPTGAKDTAKVDALHQFMAQKEYASVKTILASDYDNVVAAIKNAKPQEEPAHE